MNGPRPPMSVASTASVPLSSPSPSESPPPPPQLHHSHPPSSLSLGLVPLSAPSGVSPQAPAPPDAPLARVRLADLSPYEGAPSEAYHRAVEALSGSLTRHNAAVIELGSEESVVIRCALESARLYFKARACSGKSSRAIYTYRAGRPLEDGDWLPPCMSDSFRYMGKAARVSLSAIARHLRLRSDVFNQLLDDTPLPANEISSSVLAVAYTRCLQQHGNPIVGVRSSNEVEKGLVTLVASDYPGVQVCDPNGRWYLADSGLGPGDLLLLTGKALSHATAGLRPAASHRAYFNNASGLMSGGRASLTFRLIPQANAILDCSPISAAGHCIPQSYQPVSVSQFMDDLLAEEDVFGNHPENTYVNTSFKQNLRSPEAQTNLSTEPSLRSILSDPLSGAFLEDAVVVSCGHSFGGHMLKKVIGMARCTLCNVEIDPISMIPNIALRAAAKVVKMEDNRRLFHNAALRKRRREVGEQIDALNRPGKENGAVAADSDSTRQLKGVQNPFVVSEKVLIKGNRRTPDKFVGREAIITSQCLNGWYLLQILDTGEKLRLQYRSLQKLSCSDDTDERPQPPTLAS